MFRKFSVKNFRCFRDLTIQPLDRVNLIAGKNGVGKTALLEALFLHIGPHNPTLPMQINVLRGIPQAALDPELSWRWMYHDIDVSEPVQLLSTDDKNIGRALQVRIDAQVSSAITREVSKPRSPSDSEDDDTPSVIPGSVTTALGPKELILDYEDTAGRRAVARASLTQARDALEVSLPRLEVPLGLFLTARARLGMEDVERFSTADRLGRHRSILNAVRIVEPRLKRLAVEVAGGAPFIYGDVGIGQLLPVQLLGEGISRLVAIVSAIANAPGGVVLVDEIENGLHHSVMVDVWKAIASAARRSKTQVFATTHSRECIQAAHTAFGTDSKYDFRLHRLERIKGRIEAITYDQRTLEAALEADLEVR